jgi:hypothetical protein
VGASHHLLTGVFADKHLRNMNKESDLERIIKGAVAGAYVLVAADPRYFYGSPVAEVSTSEIKFLCIHQKEAGCALSKRSSESEIGVEHVAQ